jgi:hypothetical protein
MPKTAKKTPSASLYSVHPSIAYAQSIIDNLPKTTGKSIDEWVRVIRDDGPNDDKACRAWLKEKHKLGSTTAWMVAARALGTGDDDTDPEAYLRQAPEYVEAMYAGPKAALRPLHDALVALGRAMGADVKVCPCKTIVPLYRNHVFAEVKPSTRTRIDFGLALKEAKKKPPKRLTPTGGLEKGDRITHRFAISALGDIDDEVRAWTKIAYDLDA